MQQPSAFAFGAHTARTGRSWAPARRRQRVTGGGGDDGDGDESALAALARAVKYTPPTWPPVVSDDTLLFGDLLVVLMLACGVETFQLAAAPDFAGWGAPIPAVPAHLGDTVSNAARLGACWCLG